MLVSLGSLLVYSALSKTSPLGALKTILSGQKPAAIPDIQPAAADTGSGGGTPAAGGSAGPDEAAHKAYARSRLAAFGWSDAEWPALEQLWDHENSTWDPLRENPTSEARGIPQALPKTKLLDPAQGGGPDGLTNAATQINWGLTYIKGRYGSPTRAWAFWQAHRWY